MSSKQTQSFESQKFFDMDNSLSLFSLSLSERLSMNTNNKTLNNAQHSSFNQQPPQSTGSLFRGLQVVDPPAGYFGKLTEQPKSFNQIEQYKQHVLLDSESLISARYEQNNMQHEFLKEVISNLLETMKTQTVEVRQIKSPLPYPVD